MMHIIINIPRVTKLACFLSLLMIFSSCKSIKKITGVKTDELSPAKVQQQMIQNQVQADWLTAKAKLGFEGLGQKMGATSTIKLRKDSLLWMNVKKLGFEVARVQVTKDSVFVLNRLTNEFLAKDLDYLERQYNLPADFNTLQALILGNPIFFVNRNLKLENTPEAYHLFATEGSKVNDFWLSPGNFLLNKMSFEDKSSRRSLALLLQDYTETSDNQNFSYLRNVDLNSQETGQVNIEISFSKVVLNEPTAFRFDVPKRYTRVD